MTTISNNNRLKIVAGKRHLTLKQVDWLLFVTNKPSRGQLLPRGFRQVSSIEPK